MVNTNQAGHWYKCKECGKKIPIPDYIFITQDGEKIDEIEEFCPFCDIPQFFKLSGAKKLCSKKEALSHFTIQKQIEEGKIRFKAYWNKE